MSFEPSFTVTHPIMADLMRNRRQQNCDKLCHRAVTRFAGSVPSPRCFLLDRLLDPTVQTHAVCSGGQGGSLVQVGTKPQVERSRERLLRLDVVLLAEARYSSMDRWNSRRIPSTSVASNVAMG